MKDLNNNEVNFAQRAEKLHKLASVQRIMGAVSLSAAAVFALSLEQGTTEESTSIRGASLFLAAGVFALSNARTADQTAETYTAASLQADTNKNQF